MGVEIERGGTEWVGDPVTLKRGTAADIVSVASYHNVDPSIHPTVADFTDAAVLVKDASDPLYAGTLEVVTRIGARGEVTLTPGDHQRWTLVSTADEDVIRATGTITIK